jgi:hypothetical protein
MNPKMRHAYEAFRYGLIAWRNGLRAWVSRKPLILVGCHSGPFAGNAYHFLKHTHRRTEACVLGVIHAQARYALVKEGLPWVLRGGWMARFLANRATVVLGTGYPYGNIGPESSGALQVMMWHGMPIKGIGLQCLPEPAHFPETDFCIATSPYTADIMRRVFGLPADRVLCTGEPKTDGFVDPNRPDLRKALGGSYKKVVLYAPTFRDDFLHPNGRRDPGSLVGEVIRSEAIRQVLAKHEACMVLALHPFERTLFEEQLEPPFYFSVSLDISTEHLMAGADFLLSDYSSLIVDWLLLSRPMALFCPDIANYKQARGFPYFDFEGMFGDSIHRDIHAVSEAIDQGLDGDCGKDYSTLKRLFHLHEAGGASERLFEMVIRLKSIHSTSPRKIFQSRST